MDNDLTTMLLQRRRNVPQVGEALRALAFGIRGNPEEYKPLTTQDNDMEKLITSELIKRQFEQEDPYRQSQVGINKKILEQMNNPSETVYYDPNTGVPVPPNIAIPEMQSGKNFITSRRIATRQGIKEEPIKTIKDIKQEEENKRQQELESQSVLNSTNDTLDTIKEVKNGIKNFGALGSFPSLPFDYPRKKWESNVQKLLSGKVIDIISEMKRVSKTGATGFGQLSEKEGQILREASTALNRGLSPQDALVILDKMENELNKIKYRNSNIQNPVNQPQAEPTLEELMAEKQRRMGR